MERNKYKYFYVNGCSFSEGGGLEEPELWDKYQNTNSYRGFMPTYKKYYNVSWKSRKYVNWGYRLSKIIDVKCINESLSGSGPDRVIRMAYDFLYKYWKIKDKIFLLLELPGADRTEVFYTKTGKYYVVNSKFDNDNNCKFIHATRDYWPKKQSHYIEDNDTTEIFKTWFESHFNLEEQIKQIDKDIVGLYSFCTMNNIPIYLMDNIPDNQIISWDDNIDQSHIIESVQDWCTNNKMSIDDEIGKYHDEYTDGHPGYFGHIEYAKYIAKELGFETK